jgi:predicted P-loop ATPase
MQTAGQEALTAVENKQLDAKEFWQTAADLATKLLKNAPAEISKEAEISGSGVIKLVALLKKIDYNFDLLTTDKTVAAEFTKLSSDPSYDVANKAVDKYLEESCGIPQGS